MPSLLHLPPTLPIPPLEVDTKHRAGGKQPHSRGRSAQSSCCFGSLQHWLWFPKPFLDFLPKVLFVFVGFPITTLGLNYIAAFLFPLIISSLLPLSYFYSGLCITRFHFLLQIPAPQTICYSQINPKLSYCLGFACIPPLSLSDLYSVFKAQPKRSLLWEVIPHLLSCHKPQTTVGI